MYMMYKNAPPPNVNESHNNSEAQTVNIGLASAESARPVPPPLSCQLVSNLLVQPSSSCNLLEDLFKHIRVLDQGSVHQRA